MRLSCGGNLSLYLNQVIKCGTGTIYSTAAIITDKKAVLSQGNRAMPQLFVFGLKFADVHYKFKSSQASKARLQSSICTGAKQNLTQNGHSRSHVLESRWKGDKGSMLPVILNTYLKICWPYLLRFRRCSVYERSAVFPRIPNTPRITFRYSACHISASHALHNPPQRYW